MSTTHFSNPQSHNLPCAGPEAVTPMPELSIIIINYRSADFTRKCLQSIRANAREMALEIIVIDNASHDECGQIVRTEFPEVVFIQSEENLGFAGANNLGAARSQGRFLLFLNPDTEVQGTALQSLFHALESTPDAAMVGGRLLNSDLSVQTTSITAFPSIINQTFGAESLRRRFPKSALWGMRALFEDHAEPVSVDAISGACMMIRREVFAAVQGFTSEYFMYAEDLDLCLKVSQAGWKVRYVPDAVVVHHGGQSSSSRPESNYAAIMIRESMAQFMKRHNGLLHAATFRVVTGLNAIFRLLILAILSPLAIPAGKRQLFRNRLGKWVGILNWALGLQTWAKREGSRRDSFPVAQTTEAR
jgi:N-acetylglucosaminyl-diphospho-decaprenol L-rhamnosyltransferase